MCQFQNEIGNTEHQENRLRCLNAVFDWFDKVLGCHCTTVHVKFRLVGETILNNAAFRIDFPDSISINSRTMKPSSWKHLHRKILKKSFSMMNVAFRVKHTPRVWMRNTNFNSIDRSQGHDAQISVCGGGGGVSSVELQWWWWWWCVCLFYRRLRSTISRNCGHNVNLFRFACQSHQC